MLRRYTNIEYILSMSLDDFMDFLRVAEEADRDQQIQAQWTAMLPLMSAKILKFMSFKEYKEQATGENIDMRPADEIIADIEEAHARMNRK